MTHPPTPLPDASTSIAPEPPRSQRLFLPVILSTVLMTLAFPPADLGFLAWVGLAPLLYVLPKASRPRRAFGLGYLFGYLHWGATVGWIGTTVSAWTHSPVGWVAWIGLAAVKSGWYGLFGWGAWWISRRTEGISRVVALASAWTIMEWLRCQTGVAMPWSLIGYTQYRYLLLIQAAEIAGVFIVTWGLCAFGAGLAELWRVRVEEERVSWRPMAPGVIALLFLALYGAITLGRDYGGSPIRLALMQPNERSFNSVGAEEAHDPVNSYWESLSRFQQLSAQPSSIGADLVVWPESAVPQSPLADARINAIISQAAKRTKAWYLVGSGHEDQRGKSYNSAFLFDPDGQIADRYDKTWLVPFGEWVPLRPLIPFDNVFHFPPDTTPGAVDAILSAGNVKMSVLICYETVFPIVSRTRVARGANLLVSITNDSWAGESAELQQHIAMSAFRAVETRRYLASSATTGITGLIAPTGEISAIPPYKQNLKVAEAKLRDGLTPYVRWGDWFVGVCAALLIFFTAKNAKNDEDS